MERNAHVLILEPDEGLASAIADVLGETAPGAEPLLARDLEQAQALALGEKPELFVLDLDAAPDLGQDFLYDLRTTHPDARAIVLTAANLGHQREQVAGLGAIHFSEKPFSRENFAGLIRAALRPESDETEKFRGTLSDLHMADIIQLKCLSGSSSVLEFTGPRGEKARVFFENGQVRHATAPGREGLAAFNEIVTWKGGTIAEVANGGSAPRTIDQDWQFLLMDAVRESDERKAAPAAARFRPKQSSTRKVLVIDDSLMMLRFVEEILTEANFQVATAPNAQEGLQASKANPPDLVLLDYLLPDMKGDEVSRLLHEDRTTADVPVVFMSGFGADLQARKISGANVTGFLNKPFTSDLLIKTVETNMPQPSGESEPNQPRIGLQVNESANRKNLQQAQQPVWQEQPQTVPASPAAAEEQDWWTPPPGATPDQTAAAPAVPAMRGDFSLSSGSNPGGPFFCGDTSFFSLNWALQTIGKEKLSGSLRAHWQNAPIELLAQDGQIMLATARDPDFYCPDAPITLVNVDPARVAAARDVQSQTGCPLFLTLARENLILRDPAIQLVHHYGQKLFAQLWTAPRVRFVFEQSGQLPDYAFEVTPEPEIDHWELESLRFIQFQDLGEKANYDPMCIPAYTRDGFERAQNLKLTVAEAQFASQFNGVRSIAQIAKNLRLDLKFARLTLFRFLALEVVECWPPVTTPRPEGKGVFQRLGRSIGIGE